MVLSELLYLSTYDLLNSSATPKYYVVAQCSWYVSLANQSHEILGKILK